MGTKSKPQTQTAFAFGAPADPAAEALKVESIVAHEQIASAANFEHIAKAKDVGSLTNAWKTLADGITAEEFERRGYGLAIRRRARAVLLKEQHKAGNGAAGVTADAALERLIREGELPPRPGQVIDPPEPTTADNVTPISKAKRSRKKAANG